MASVVVGLTDRCCGPSTSFRANGGTSRQTIIVCEQFCVAHMLNKPDTNPQLSGPIILSGKPIFQFGNNNALYLFGYGYYCAVVASAPTRLEQSRTDHKLVVNRIPQNLYPSIHICVSICAHSAQAKHDD